MNEKEKGEFESKIQEAIKDKVILITGGTGSFGSVVTKRLLQYGPKQILVFSRDEKKQLDMANDIADERVRFLIGDVRDRDRITYIMQGVDLVFHAAALKQVPQCEFFPTEAILTNAMGAANVINSAVHHGVKRLVILSTDKAVYPVNVMGMTKALMERTMIAVSREKRNGTLLCGTRYGNVMYTRGSVIPHFVDLIKKGKQLELTEPKMTRFMMTLDQSVDLVLYALTHGGNGDLYVQKAPATTMGNLAEALASLFGYDKGYKTIGIRPGEKMYETLISNEEASRVEDCGAYYRIAPEVPNMDSIKYYHSGIERSEAFLKEGYTSLNTTQLSVEDVKNLLHTLPEIRSELDVFKKQKC